jgi:hypothetical protein
VYITRSMSIRNETHWMTKSDTAGFSNTMLITPAQKSSGAERFEYFPQAT